MTKKKNTKKKNTKIIFKNDFMVLEEFLGIAGKVQMPTLVKKTKYYYIERVDLGSEMQKVLKENNIENIKLDEKKYYRFSVRLKSETVKKDEE